MSLSTYKKKRSFEITTEPTGGKSKSTDLFFTVQKHAASHLHYDFRLEMEGVLKSWAIPKGPSTDPSVKRLAMMVEDHPYDYKDFEGVIPKGQYGGGSVIVWDNGTYEPLDPVTNKDEAEKHLLHQLKAGSLKFRLNGHKLKGEFALVKTHGRGENSWLLIKHRDRYAKEADITKKDKSVISGKTLEKMAAKPAQVYGWQTISPDSTAKDKASPRKKGTASEKAGVNGKIKHQAERKIKKVMSVKEVEKLPKNSQMVSPDLSDAPKAAFPTTISPMLATLVDKPFDEPGWIYEIKWDGYRAVALCNTKEVNLISRNNKPFNEKFYPVYDAVKKLEFHAVLDGEIAVLKGDGISSFGALQNWRSEADGDLVYYVFDLLWVNGHDLMQWPLSRRREILKQILPKEGIVRESESFETTATDFLQAAKDMGLEGIIAKKADSSYRPGDRTRDWLKIKVNKRHEVVIGGYTKNDDSPKPFSSLLVGVFEKGRLNYMGKIGTGFNDKQQKEMISKFKTFITDIPPFKELPDINKPSRFRPNPPNAKAIWLKPELVCEVSYTELTDEGIMRHPAFEGMREDKSAKDVHAEKAKPTREIVDQKGRPATIKNQISKKKNSGKEEIIKLKPATTKYRQTLLNPADETQVRKVNGHELKFGNLSKVFWSREKYTKRDMLNYYYQVAPFILPYLKDRPQSLNRFPNGIDGKSFYHKDVTATAPEWVKQFPYHTSDGEDKNFLVVEDEASILWMANLGAVEMNPWNSTIKSPNYPDWCIIDLDPTDKNTFDQVIQTAQVTKKILDDLGVQSYPKTSGSTGMHIYIPLAAKYTYDECQLFGRMVATHVHSELPKFTSIERMTHNRKGKIYVDFLQNRAKATLAAPYSVRPKPGATVSMPIHWEEVKKGLKMSQFNIRNAMERIKAEGDLFKPVLGKGIDIAKAIKKLN